MHIGARRGQQRRGSKGFTRQAVAEGGRNRGKTDEGSRDYIQRAEAEATQGNGVTEGGAATIQRRKQGRYQTRVYISERSGDNTDGGITRSYQSRCYTVGG